MALKKQITLPTSAAAEYHRINGCYYNRRENFVEILTDVFTDQLACQNGAAPHRTDVVRLTGEQAEAAMLVLHDLVGPILYGALKLAAPAEEGQPAPYAGAVDVDPDL